MSVQDTWNLSAVLPVVSLSSDATPLPAHKPSAINTKTDTKTDKVAGATVPAFRGVVPATNKAHAQPAASKNKGATQAERHLVTADVCLTTKKGMALTNKASSGCHLPFRCLYNYTMEVRAPRLAPHRMIIYPLPGPCVGFTACERFILC